MVFCAWLALGNRLCPTSVSILRLCSVIAPSWGCAWKKHCFHGQSYCKRKCWLFLGACSCGLAERCCACKHISNPGYCSVRSSTHLI